MSSARSTRKPQDDSTQRIVPAASMAAPQTQAAASVFHLAGTDAAAGRRRRSLPPVDLQRVQVHQRLEPPFHIQRKGRTKYDELVAQLTTDGMAATGIPAEYYGSLSKAIDKSINPRLAPAGSRLLLRTLANGTLGVFRVARKA